MATRGTPFKRNFKDEEYREPGEGYNGPLPQRGIYPAKLVVAEEHTSKEGNDGSHWAFELLDGAENKNGDSVAGWRGHVYTNDDTAAWKEQQVLVGVGLIKPNGAINSTYEQMLKRAKPCKVRVIHEQYTDPDGDGEAQTTAKITAVIPGGDVVAPKSRRRAKDDDDDDDADDAPFEDEDEDEEEEEPPRRSSRRRAKAEPEPEEDEDEDEDEDDEDEEGDDEEVDLDELAEELAELTLVQLKKKAKADYSFTDAKLRGKKADAIIDLIIEKVAEEQEADEDDEEPEEEPEPPRRARRGAAKTGGAAKATSTRRRRGSSDEPPF